MQHFNNLTNPDTKGHSKCSPNPNPQNDDDSDDNIDENTDLMICWWWFNLKVAKWISLSANDNCSTIASSSLETLTQDWLQFRACFIRCICQTLGILLIKKEYLYKNNFYNFLACSALKSGKHVRGCQNSQSVLRKIHTHPSHSLPQKWLNNITIKRYLVKTKEGKLNEKV